MENNNPNFLRRLFGGPEPLAPPVADAVAADPAPINGVDDLETEPLKEIWRLLETLRGERTMLSRADIEPSDLKRVLPTVCLIEVHRQPLRFRFRLAGTAWRTDLGFEPTGMWLHDWPHQSQKQLWETAWTAATEARRALRARRHAIVDGVRLVYEAIMMPLSKDGEAVDMLLIMTAPWRTDAVPTMILGSNGL
jgi:hypothetical protein